MANKKVSQLTSKPSVLTTDLFPIADPSTGQLYKTTISDLGTAIGSGVSSVNGLVGAVVLDTDDIQELVSPTNKWFTDTRARAALSASSPLTYNSGTGVFGIQVATGSQNGYLSSADWTTFNAKQAALSGTGFVKISGTTISYDNSTYLTTSSAASTYLSLTGGTLTGALQVNGYLSAQVGGAFYGDVVLSGTNPRLYFTDTDNNPDYFISNTDGTFTIYDVTSSVSRFTLNGTTGTFGGNLTVGSIIKSGGTSSQFLKADGSVDSTAYLPLAGGTLTGALFATSASFSGFVGFGGNTSPLAAIDVTGVGIFSSSVRSSGYYLTGMTSGSGALYYNSGANRVTVANYNTSGIVVFEVNGGSTALTLNSNLSATFSSDVTAGDGTGSVSMAINRGAAGNSNGLRFRTAGTNNWYIGSGATGANTNLEIYNHNTATTNLLLNYSSGAATFSSSVTATKIALNTTVSSSTLEVLGANSQWAGSFTGNSSASGSYGVVVAAGTNTNDIAFRINNAANSSTYFNVRGDGNVGIGTTSPGNKLQVVANVGSGGTGVVDIFNNGGIDNAPPLTLTKSSATTTSDARFLQFYASSQSQPMGGIVGNGANNVQFATLSDIREKENIKSISGSLSKILALNPVEFDWKKTKEHTNAGFIAQEVEKIFPEYVIENFAQDGQESRKGLTGGLTGGIIPILVNAIQELKAELDTLKNK